MDTTSWFDELEWKDHVYEIVDDDGVKISESVSSSVEDTVTIWEATYPSDENTNILIMHDYGWFATWQALIWEASGAPTLVEGRGPFESLDHARQVMRQWFKDGNPIQRWTEHTAQRRTWPTQKETE